jgi:hypothetical protein
MTRQNAIQTQQQAASASPLSQGGILQRQCESCGQHTIAGGECADCEKKKIGLQRKLTIGASNDPLEQEADRVADLVMSASPSSVANSTPPKIQRFTGQQTGEAMTAPASVDRVLSSPGRPLDPSLQQDMGQRFGHDFSRVRIHTGVEAERSARDVNANAYTVGQNVVFASGQYEPREQRGRHLVAHELTHVIQQSGSMTPYVARSVDDWLSSSIKLSTLSYTQLLSEADELAQYLDRQTTSSADTARIEEVLTMLRVEINRRKAKTDETENLPGRNARRDPRGRSRRAAVSPKSALPLPERYPRVLTEMTSVAYDDPVEMRAEYDLIMQWLAREEISKSERRILIEERNRLDPQLSSDRERVVYARHAERVSAALTPAAKDEANALRQLASTIENITADPSNPNIFAIYHQGERVTISRVQRDRLHVDLMTALQKAARAIDSRSSYYWNRYNSQLAINRDSPIIAAISGWLADVEDPGNELSSRYFRVRSQISTMQELLAGRRIVDAATLLPDIDRTGQEIQMLARTYYEGLIEGAEIAVQRLEFTRDASFAIAGSIAAVVAAPVVAGYVAGAGFTGTTATVLTIGGTGATVGGGVGFVRGTSAVGGELVAGNSLNQALGSFRSEFSRGFREGFVAGAAGGASRLLGLTAGVSASVGEQVFIRVAGDFVVNSTSTMLDVLWQSCTNGNCDVDQAVRLGITSGLTSIPGSIVGLSNNAITRNFIAPLTVGATTYVGAISSGVSPEEAMRSAGLAITTQLAMSRAAHNVNNDAALFERGRSMGESNLPVKKALTEPVGSLGATVEVGTPKKEQVEPTQPKKPSIAKSPDDAVKFVEENPNVIKGEPGSRRAAVGEGHEIVEIPGVGCELHSPPPHIKVPCPKGMGRTKQEPSPDSPNDFVSEGGGKPYRGTGKQQMARNFAHDVGVAEGAKAAQRDKLSWFFDNPRGANPTTPGFDAIYKDPSGNFVIVEFKGGEAALKPGQMTNEWVNKEILKLEKEFPSHPVVKELRNALDKGQLSGRTYSTKISETGQLLDTTRELHETYSRLP